MKTNNELYNTLFFLPSFLSYRYEVKKHYHFIKGDIGSGIFFKTYAPLNHYITSYLEYFKDISKL